MGNSRDPITLLDEAMRAFGRTHDFNKIFVNHPECPDRNAPARLWSTYYDARTGYEKSVIRKLKSARRKLAEIKKLAKQIPDGSQYVARIN